MALPPTQMTVIYSDLNYQFTTNTQGDVAVSYNVDAVAGSIMNILGTNRGERVMLPQFGANLMGVLFQRMNKDFTKMVSDQIKTQIETWDPRVQIISMTYTQDPLTLSMTLVVNFAVKGLPGVQTLTQAIP